MQVLLNDISENAPYGIDARYEDRYLEVESEIDKSLSATGSGKTDWSLIVEETEKILTQQTKDLKILSYWLYAAWKISSWRGLEKNISLYKSFLLKYGKNLFPKSDKVKQRSLEWLVDNLSSELLSGYTKENQEVLKVVIKELSEIDAIVQNNIIKDSNVIFSSLIRKLKKIEEEVRRENVSIAKSVEKGINTLPKEKKKEKYSRLESLDSMMSSFKNEIEKNDFLFFTIMQTVGLLELDDILSANKKEKAEEFYFQNREKMELISLFNKDEEDISLEELKKLLYYCPVWLDGYLILINKINIKYKKIFLNSFEYNLTNFIQNYNGNILKNYLKTKFFSEKIANFIENNDNDLEKNSQDFDKYREGYLEATSLVESKKNEDGLIYLDTLEQESRSQEESFLWRLKSVELSIKVGNQDLALGILFDLKDQVEEFNLAIWNPKLALKVYKLFLKPSIIKKLNIETKESIYRKVCKISTKEAINNSFL